ncbi:MAG: class I SAM-dependent methyltransferase [Cyanobacteria bacterium]|nr:class I SAM-dependent methyltransferase [Cyanobacteriota bacterium]MDW8200492.1 class I SAM-dependent methyltransferase [Cyanobacteriota bacterium SKYGB_h_bin112]
MNTSYRRLEGMLRCPLTATSLRLLTPEELMAVNDRYDSLTHLGGTPVGKPLEAGFSTIDGKLLYPVWDDIVRLLPAWAIVVQPNQVALDQLTIPLASIKTDVQAFYDQVGWTEVTDNVFTDAARFEDLRPVAQEYIHRCNMRVRRYLPAKGDFLLDIASGPLQHPDYITYSENYHYRICGDISLVALQAARRKLGDRGIYLLCDITCIPLQDNVVDSFVSLHTIYHVPAEEQALAFTELHRVLKPNRTGVVVYSWGPYSWLMLATLLPIKLINTCKRLWQVNIWKRLQQRLHPQPSTTQEPLLYFHPQPYCWVKQVIASQLTIDIFTWRSVSVLFTKAYAHERLGRALLRLVYQLEEQLPRLMGRLGAYPLIVIKK